MAAPNFAPVTLSRPQAARLESMMQQQVQDAVLAHTAQRMKDHKLDSDWRFVSSLGQLKTFKTPGRTRSPRPPRGPRRSRGSAM